METELACLYLQEGEDDRVLVQRDISALRETTEFSLVRCFLTASINHYPAMKSTLANIWHSVKVVQIVYLGEKIFMFTFFHKMDLDRVLNRAQWMFNNHLLIFHYLEIREDPIKVP